MSLQCLQTLLIAAASLGAFAVQRPHLVRTNAALEKKGPANVRSLAPLKQSPASSPSHPHLGEAHRGRGPVRLKHALLFGSSGELSPYESPAALVEATTPLPLSEEDSRLANGSSRPRPATAFVIRSSGNIDTAALQDVGPGSMASAAVVNGAVVLAQGVQVPAAAVLTTAAAVAAEPALTTAATPAAASAETTPAAAAATPANAAATPANAAATPSGVAAAPDDAGGGFGLGQILILILMLAVLVAAMAAVLLYIWRKEKQAGRFGAEATVKEDEIGGDSQFWKSAKSRQSYRKSAVNRAQGATGQDSDSDDDSRAPRKQPSSNLEANADARGQIASASSRGASYRDRRIERRSKSSAALDADNAADGAQSGAEASGTEGVPGYHRAGRSRSKSRTASASSQASASALRSASRTRDANVSFKVLDGDDLAV